MNHFKALLVSLGTATLLTACLKTDLSSPPLDARVFRLAAASARPIHIEVTSESPEANLGHQYLLFAIPFGRITSDNVSMVVQRALYSKLALRGYTPLVNQSARSGFGAAAATLKLQIHDPQASAFDLFFVRHLSCSLNLKAQFSKQDSERRADASGTFDDFRAFAFEKEMSLCFTQALDIALDRLLNELRM